MSRDNEFFQHEDRASYELGMLLRALPKHVHADSEISRDQALMLDAAHSHAGNLNSALLHGLESIGHFMYSAAVNKTALIDPKHFASLGVLVSELAAQLQFLDEFSGSIADRELQLALKGNAQ